MALNILKISLEWEERQGDCSLCLACNEPIFYKMHVLVIDTGEEKEDTKWKLCDSCYNITEDE